MGFLDNFNFRKDTKNHDEYLENNIDKYEKALKDTKVNILRCQENMDVLLARKRKIIEMYETGNLDMKFIQRYHPTCIYYPEFFAEKQEFVDKKSQELAQQYLKIKIAKNKYEKQLNYIRPNNINDINERELALSNFAESIKQMDKDGALNLRFCSTSLVTAENIFQNETLSDAAYDCLSISDIHGVQHSIKLSADLMSYKSSLPAGCTFVLQPQVTEMNNIITGEELRRTYFNEHPEQLIGVVTTSENIELIRSWAKEVGLSQDIVSTFNDFPQKLHEKFKDLIKKDNNIKRHKEELTYLNEQRKSCKEQLARVNDDIKRTEKEKEDVVIKLKKLKEIQSSNGKYDTDYFTHWNKDYMQKLTTDPQKLQEEIEKVTENIIRKDEYIKRSQKDLKYIRPNTKKDDIERKSAVELFATAVEQIDSGDMLKLRIHSTTLSTTKDILDSKGIISSVDRLDGYVATTNDSNQISVSDIYNIQYSLNYWTDLKHNTSYPAGCMFVLQPKTIEEAGMIEGRQMNNVYFDKHPEQLVGIVTTTENVELVRSWVQEAGLSTDVVSSFDDFPQILQERFNDLDRIKDNLEPELPIGSMAYQVLNDYSSNSEFNAPQFEPALSTPAYYDIR